MKILEKFLLIMVLLTVIVCAGIIFNESEAKEATTTSFSIFPKSIRLNRTRGTLEVGRRQQLKAYVSPRNTTVKVLRWESLNRYVAIVSNNGLVTARRKGTATIVVKTANGKTARFSLTVTQPVTKIRLNKRKVEIEKKKKVKLKATISPSNANNKTIKWKSDNTRIATVNSIGEVKAKKEGTTTITAISSNGKMAKCKITVKKIVRKAKFTAYFPDDSELEGGYYDIHDKLLDPSKNTCAAPSSIPYGTKIKVDGTGTSIDGKTFTVNDRGSAIKILSNGTYRIDILKANKKQCDNFGIRKGTITFL